eukprot:Gb_21303 [translate_table: standard]
MARPKLHDDTVTNDQIATDLKEHVIKQVVPSKYMDENTIFHLNLFGHFVIGGSYRDAGLTRRKIIIDTYGGWGTLRGGTFSGKDPAKVDRSGAYIVRQDAKSVVSSTLAWHCIVQVSYAIGALEPLFVVVDTYRIGNISDGEIFNLIKESFDSCPVMAMGSSVMWHKPLVLQYQPKRRLGFQYKQRWVGLTLKYLSRMVYAVHILDLKHNLSL